MGSKTDDLSVQEQCSLLNIETKNDDLSIQEQDSVVSTDRSVDLSSQLCGNLQIVWIKGINNIKGTQKEGSYVTMSVVVTIIIGCGVVGLGCLLLTLLPIDTYDSYEYRRNFWNM